jgi:hypothetical protein
LRRLIQQTRGGQCGPVVAARCAGKDENYSLHSGCYLLIFCGQIRE